MSILVSVYAPNGKIHKTGFEAINYAKKIADKTGDTVTAVIAGECSNLQEAGNYGAAKVLHAAEASASDCSVISNVVSQAAKQENSKLVIFSHDLEGRAIAPMLATHLDAGYVPGAIALPSAEGGFKV